MKMIEAKALAHQLCPRHRRQALSRRERHQSCMLRECYRSLDLQLATIQNEMMTKSSVLSPVLEELLDAIGKRLHHGQSVEAELPSVLAHISNLPASTISQADPAIGIAANLSRWRPEPRWSAKLFRPYLSDKEQLSNLPGLCYLFLFHRDGRLREAALDKITGGLQSPFLFAAVTMRLNDWAEPVRAAAFACAKRCFPLTSAEVIANAATSLVLHQDSWGRWGLERQAMEAALARPEVAEKLADILCKAQTGPSARVFRLLLKNSSIDPHLPRLAATAGQPWVRAVAVKVITDARAGWQVGWEWKWIDKSMGRRQREAKFSFRDVHLPLDKLAVIRAAASDTSPIVRRAALTALIQHWHGSSAAGELASTLRTDRSPSVRERAAFISSRSGKPAIPRDTKID